MPYKIYSHLVLDPTNKDIDEAIVTAAKAGLEDAQDGIVLGTEFFDQMGKYAEFDGLAAMKKLVNALGPEIGPKDVTVVVNYRRPRFEHWESIWKDFVEGTKTTYDEFLCTATEYHKKMELLATAMNPLQVAQASLDQGWNVALIDMEGVEAADMDVAHSIACDVMLGKCTDEGWVKRHEGESLHNKEAEQGHEITELTDQEKDAAERLFEARDCAYQTNLTAAPSFQVVRHKSLWKGCEDTAVAENAYEQFLDVELIFRGLLSQVECPGRPVQYDHMPASVEEVLSGNFELHPVPASGKSGGKGGRRFLFLLLVFGFVGAVFMAHKHPNEANQLLDRVKVTVRNVSEKALGRQQKRQHSRIPGEAEMEPMPVSATTGMSDLI